MADPTRNNRQTTDTRNRTETNGDTTGDTGGLENRNEQTEGELDEQAEFELAEKLSEEAVGTEEPPEIIESEVDNQNESVEDTTPLGDGELEDVGPEGGGEELEEGELEEVPVEEVVAETPVVETPVSTGAAGDPPIVRAPPESWMDAFVSEEIPLSADLTQGVIDAGNEVGQTPTQVAPDNANQIGFGEQLRNKIGDAILGPLMPGFFGRAVGDVKGQWESLNTAWDKPSNGFLDGARNKIDIGYQFVDLVSKVTGPLATVLGVASYMKYLFFLPPCVAIGNFLSTIATFLNGVNLILDVVKLALGALKIVFGALAYFAETDPTKRAEYLDSLLGDSLNFAADGFSVFMAGAMKNRENGQTWRESFNPKNAFSTSFSEAWGSAKGIFKPNMSGMVGGATKRSLYSVSAAQQLMTQTAAANKTTVLGSMGNDLLGMGVTGVTELVKNTITEPTRDRRRDKTKGDGEDKMVDLTKNKGQFQVADAVLSGFTTGALLPIAPVASLAIMTNYALSQQLAQSPTPLTNSTPLPETVPTAPYRKPAIKEGRDALAREKESLLEQQKMAIAGQEEARGIKLAADDHIVKSEVAIEGAEGAKEQTEEGKTKVQEGKEELAKGKEDKEKGSSEMGGIEGKAPGDKPADSTTDVPWYKKPFVWMIRKFNEAKQAAMDKLTEIIMNAVKGALGIDELESPLGDGEAKLDEQQQVLDNEPAKLTQIQGVAQGEINAAQQGKAEADAQEQHNAKIETETAQKLAELEQQDAMLDAEEKECDTEEANFKSTYGPTLDEIDVLAQEQEKGEIGIQELEFTEQVEILTSFIDQLVAAIEGQRGAMLDIAETDASQMSNEIVGHDEIGAEQQAKALGEIDSLRAKVVGEVEATTGERQQIMGLLTGEVSGLLAVKVTNETLMLFGTIQAKIVGVGQDLEANREGELKAVHDQFVEAYNAMIAQFK